VKTRAARWERGGVAWTRLVCLAALACLTGGPSTTAQELPQDILEMMEQVRERHGLASLRQSPVLAEVAASHAAELANRRVISHHDERGGNVRDRVRQTGCTTAILGEVVGAGPDLRAIVVSWSESASHLRVLVHAPWTDVGVGVARAGDSWVAVAVLAAVAVRDLRVVGEPPQLRGTLDGVPASAPALLVDTRSIAATYWNPSSGEFAFAFDRTWPRVAYVRLGYYGRSGELVITDVLHPCSAVEGL